MTLDIAQLAFCVLLFIAGFALYFLWKSQRKITIRPNAGLQPLQRAEETRSQREINTDAIAVLTKTLELLLQAGAGPQTIAYVIEKIEKLSVEL